MWGFPARVVIAGTGHYVPEHVVTNKDLIARFGLDTTDEWLRSHVGVVERRWAAPHQATSDLAIEAGRRALAAAGLEATDLKRIVLATVSGDWISPASACVVQRELGATCPAEDKVAACAGFLFALDHGARLVATGESPVLVIGADTRSRFLDFKDRVTCPIFGDGAGAVVLTGSEERGRGLVDIELWTDGSGADMVGVFAGGSRLPASEQTVRENRHVLVIKDGRGVYDKGPGEMVRRARSLLGRHNLTPRDIDWLVVHQANRSMIERAAKLLEIDPERVPINIDRVGNTVAGTVPILFDEMVRDGRVKPGHRILFVAIGAGYTGGAALYEW